MNIPMWGALQKLMLSPQSTISDGVPKSKYNPGASEIVVVIDKRT
jgi:hypothetical protein